MLHVSRAQEPHVNQDSHTECCTLINRSREPHVNQDSHTECCMLIISNSFSKRIIKIHLKIPACESQHILLSNLSQIHSYHGVKRPNKQKNSNLWEVFFLSAAMGMLRPFPVHFIPLQPNSTQPNMHDSHAGTENYMKYGF